MSVMDGFMAMAAVVTMAVPLVLGIYVERAAAAFQREAFGHFLRLALLLRITVYVVASYYVLVMAGGAIDGHLSDMFDWPVTKEGGWIYARLSVATVSYLMFTLMARELRAIVRPSD